MEELILDIKALRRLQQSKYLANNSSTKSKLNHFQYCLINAVSDELKKWETAEEENFDHTIWQFLEKNKDFTKSLTVKILQALGNKHTFPIFIYWMLETSVIWEYLGKKSKQKSALLKPIMLNLVEHIDEGLTEMKNFYFFSKDHFTKLKDIYPEVTEAVKEKLIENGHRARPNHNSEIDEICRVYGAI